MREKQKELGIKTKWVFAHPDGSWIRNDTEYMQVLRRVCKNLGSMPTNNHAIRMYFNSYILTAAGVDLPNRAANMGHSVDVNSKFYTFENADYCDKTRNKVNESLDQNNL